MELRPTHKYKNFFTRAEVAQLFEVAPNTVNRWVLAGRLPSVVTPGGRRRYPAGAILQLIDEQMQGTRAHSPGAVQRTATWRREAVATQAGRTMPPRATRTGRSNRSRGRSG